jgi:hypothetical protein
MCKIYTRSGSCFAEASFTYPMADTPALASPQASNPVELTVLQILLGALQGLLPRKEALNAWFSSFMITVLREHGLAGRYIFDHSSRITVSKLAKRDTW